MNRKFKPARNTAISAIMKDSRNPTDVQRKTEGIRKTKNIDFWGIFLVMTLRFWMSKNKYRLIIVSKIESIRIAT